MIIKNDITDKSIYDKFLDLAFEVCSEFMLVVKKPPHFEVNDNVKMLLDKLEPFLREYREQFYWLGTYCAPEATVYYYDTNMDAKEIIKSYSNSLYGWLHPNLPEDLCFIKDNEPWLINTSHERCGNIETKSKEEYMRLINMGIDLDLNDDEEELFKVYDIKI